MTTLPSMQKLTDAANTNIQTFQSFADIILNASERLASLNLDAARSLCAYATTSATPLLGEGLRDQFSTRFTAHGQGLEQAAEYFRNVNEVFIKTQADVSQLNAKAAGEMTESIQALLDSMAKAGPMGAPDVVAAMKSALSNANAAYENLVKTTREMAETNLAAATNALQPMAAGNAKATKKAA